MSEEKKVVTFIVLYIACFILAAVYKWSLVLRILPAILLVLFGYLCYVAWNYHISPREEGADEQD